MNRHRFFEVLKFQTILELENHPVLIIK